MAEEQYTERSLPASPRRLEEARERGDVVRSRELISAAMILGAAILIYWGGTYSAVAVTRMAESGWGNLTTAPMTQKGFYDLMQHTMIGVLSVVVPLVGFFAVIAIVTSVGHYGFIWTSDGLTPDWGRINPISGFSRIFSWTALFELIKTFLKFLILGFVVYKIMAGDLMMIQMAPQEMLLEFARMLTRLFFFSGLVIAIIGIGDYAFQWWDHEKRLRMTPQEMKEELRQTEGNPLIRARIRSIQREMARKRMMVDVPKAAVVITNPTHLAIALAYDSNQMSVPKVVAKGAGLMAEKIREVAQEHGVMLVENKLVARALYKLVGVGEDIPSHLYRVVAEILVYVYRLRGQVPAVAG
jgi:flagellar biosynthetic protein FlhB